MIFRCSRQVFLRETAVSEAFESLNRAYGAEVRDQLGTLDGHSDTARKSVKSNAVLF